MSMESDSRLMMMAMREKANRPARVQPRNTAPRRYSVTAAASASAAASVAAFALIIFTRGI